MLNVPSKYGVHSKNNFFPSQRRKKLFCPGSLESIRSLFKDIPKALAVMNLNDESNDSTFHADSELQPTWLMIRRGVYNVRSGYKVALSGKSNGEGFDSCLGLWGNRNARFHRLKVRDVDQLIAWVSGLLAEFQSSISLLVPLGQPFLQVIRNSDGWVVAAFAKPLKCCDSAKVGEFLGLREGLVVAKQLGLPVALTEVDASSVVDGVNLLKPSLSVVGLVISDIQALCSEVGI
ncbi:hypothetical protein JRO89_XS11G0110200 [Xanthoceras sorbifolium]|uniref:RNase H type-1 domain-containing protein n=1 Tax=Xanthoceras sorbifolium TaxID=99658 RepID=A0ABQ8HF99_9ROSI|nr:hypothetical protein JRO89_XS11G0110200 [Xanthoceras sorbifolium]